MKKSLFISAITLLLTACSNNADSEEKNEEHAHEEENTQESHDHAPILDMDFNYESDTLSVTLTKEEEAYEADRVRFEVVHSEDEDATIWLNTENDDEGTYTADASELESGNYEVVIHVNGPEELHEHTSEDIEVK